ncbi:MAG: fibrobacter succinogenes major paralogous domain-containing protein [Dysgonamonadaceae bacterium]|nr:fibrobacter succinogenes major paralogous domain-containing protein [Dysgonamonadaceae bacterium]
MKQKKEASQRYIFYLLMVLLSVVVMTLVLWSCIREVGEGTGERVEVRFSSLEIAYGADETVTRGSSGGARVLETVEIPVDGGWRISADLVDDGASPLRAVPDGLVDNAKVLIAVYSSGGTCLASDVYTFHSTTADLSGGSITVSVGSSYYFVACSYNSILDAPDPLAIGETEIADIEPTDDLLWGKTGLISIASANQKIDIELRHKFMKVKLLATSRGPVLDNIFASLTTNYTARLTLFDGALVKDAETAAYTFTDNDPGSNLGSVPSMNLVSDYGIAYTAGDHPFYVNIDRLTLRVGGLPVTYTDLTVSFNSALQSGHTYTLQVNINSGIPFAGSNIYWDGKMLTFKPTGYVGKENYYQGVFFKFGSLVGISPGVSMYFTPTTPIFGYNMSSSRWQKDNAPSAFGSGLFGLTDDSYMGIPAADPDHFGYVDSDYLESNFVDDNIPESDWIHGVGDICRQIGRYGGPRGYRLPTSLEFSRSGIPICSWGDSQVPEWSPFGSFLDIPESTRNNEDGVRGLTGEDDGAALLYKAIVFPASDGRDYEGIFFHGDHSRYNHATGYYWTGSADGSVSGSHNGVAFSFNKNQILLIIRHSNENSFPVRCVKTEE